MVVSLLTIQAWTNAQRMGEGTIQGMYNGDMGKMRNDLSCASDSLFYKGEESFDLES